MWLKSRLCVFISIHGHRHAHLFLSVLFLVSLYFVLKSFFHLFLNPAMVPDENSMEDPLCNSSFGSMVSLDYVTLDTRTAKTANIVIAVRQIPSSTIVFGAENSIQNTSHYLFRFPSEALLCIKEVEMVDYLDELKSSRSIYVNSTL